VSDDKQFELYTWTVVLAHPVLEPGAALSFRSRLAAPPPGGHTVAVRFLRRDDMLAAPQ
jgi:hypothetical protein